MISRQPAPRASSSHVKSSRSTPSIGLALGGGGARGLAHIVMLEAFDEMGLKPKVISGTSIGAIFGAAYASGLSAKEIRAHTEEILSQRFSLLRDLFAARAQPMQRLLNLFSAPTALLNPDTLLDLIMPKSAKRNFEDLAIPLKIVASDFYMQEQTVFSEGPLFPAIAASMALPAVFEPVMIEGRALVDGGLTNPLPYDILETEADIIIAIDVSGAPVPNAKRDYPTAMESLFAAAFLFERSIVREKLKNSQPDILISAGTSQFQVHDIRKYKEIMAAAEPAKDRLKDQIDRVLSVETLPQLENIAPPQALLEAPAAKSKSRSGLLKRRGKTKT